MPEICRFLGIVIKMYYNDHSPPHFHAEYGEYKVVIGIDTLAIIAGQFPSRALGLVIEWSALHQNELRELWQRARQQEPLGRIDPLE